MNTTDNHIDKLTIMDVKSGEIIGEIKSSAISEIAWYSKDTSLIDIGNSYSFQCDVKIDSPELLKEFQKSYQYRTAERLAKELNDLIEEYHAPGIPRRERRAIKRDFDKVMKIFRKHCQKYMIDFKFIKG